MGYASGQIKIWNIQNQECLTTINEDRVVLQTVQTPTGDAFITAGNNAQIYIYSIHTLQKIMTLGSKITFCGLVNHGRVTVDDNLDNDELCAFKCSNRTFLYSLLVVY